MFFLLFSVDVFLKNSLTKNLNKIFFEYKIKFKEYF